MNTKSEDVRFVSCRTEACTDTRANRRDFLQSAGCFGVAVALLGLVSSEARALPVFLAAGAQAGGERRYPIPAADSVNVDHGAQLIVVRSAGHVYVFALSCPHQNNAVKWVAKDHRFQCTKHDSEYQPDGVHTAGRATRNLDRYVIRRDGDFVVVDLHRWIQSDKDPAGWAGAAITV
ncbi:MAG TPA: Rieske 2Fe-2S domain-containing protein [Vicinamibacterales bacterium]|jgi:nitrite reductase/ring-hydroxylating ferredoxin subunit|nr:Rieske 2Fe-2S domain-containing protein [Vicinamibacterales bacterium]